MLLESLAGGDIPHADPSGRLLASDRADVAARDQSLAVREKHHRGDGATEPETGEGSGRQRGAVLVSLGPAPGAILALRFGGRPAIDDREIKRVHEILIPKLAVG